MNELTIKGFAYVRSDIADVTAELQYAAFEAMFESDEPEAAVKERVRDVIADIMNDEYDMDDVGIPFGISQSLDEYGEVDRKPQPQYKGAKFANEFIYGGEAITEGDKPKYYYVEEGRTGPLRKTYDAHTAEDGTYVDCISVHDFDDMPDGVQIDREKMIEKTIVDKMEPITRTMGWGVDWMYDAIEDAKSPEDYREEGQMGFEEL